MYNHEQLVDVIRSVVSEQLAPAIIVDVSVDEDTDHDGDEILRVRVVFKVDDKKLDPQKVMGLVRHLREPLEKIKEERFPLFTFVKPDEVTGAAA